MGPDDPHFPAAMWVIAKDALGMTGTFPRVDGLVTRRCFLACHGLGHCGAAGTLLTISAPGSFLPRCRRQRKRRCHLLRSTWWASVMLPLLHRIRVSSSFLPYLVFLSAPVYCVPLVNPLGSTDISRTLQPPTIPTSLQPLHLGQPRTAFGRPFGGTSTGLELAPYVPHGDSIDGLVAAGAGHSELDSLRLVSDNVYHISVQSTHWSYCHIPRMSDNQSPYVPDGKAFA
ncbi:hypothetical protein CKAH01_08019 [Colletotrichum kahawae]|uniref:Uncharacterized protein n=1 Tax=Colletotrichum kahawae TaxID=34407 RepID=A0AAD9Y5H8_COLKA|nr:hypothetical protein CKAH01_08019 [Colletotrichum kahawae]